MQFFPYFCLNFINLKLPFWVEMCVLHGKANRAFLVSEKPRDFLTGSFCTDAGGDINSTLASSC